MKWFKKIILNTYVIGPVLLVFFALSMIVFPQIVVKKNPSVQFPIIRIYGTIPNLTKDQITNVLVYPLMNQLRHDTDIKESYIDVNHGSLYVVLQYFDDNHTESRLWSLKTIMARLKDTAQLPSGTSFHFYRKDIESRIKPFIIGVTWESGQTQDYQTIREIRSQFQSIPGIKQVDAVIDPESILIELDPTKMAENQIRLGDVSAALRGLSETQVDRVMTYADHTIVLSQKPHVYTLDLLYQLPIQTVMGQQFRLGDISTITMGLGKYKNRGQVTINQNDSVLMGLSLYPNVSVTDIEQEIYSLIQTLNQRPGYPTTRVIHNQAIQVGTFIHNFKWNILLGSLLILVSLLILTTVKMGLLTAIMLPLTCLFSMSILVLSGIQLQQVSLAGFIIALGLVVDNAIVLQETVDVQSKKMDKVMRIYVAVKQVFPSIAVSTVTTLMAFAPIYFIKSEEGLFLRSLPVSIWINLSVAFILSVTLLPWLLYCWPKHWKLNLPSISPLFHGPFQQKYGRLLHYCFKRPWIIFSLIIFSIGLSFGVARHITLELMPSKKALMFYINLSNPNQSIDIPKAQVAALESFLLKEPGVVRVVSSIGQSIPRLDLSFQEIGSDPGDAQLLIYAASERAKKRLINDIKTMIPTLPYTPKTLLASLTYSEVFEYPITIELYGTNHNELLVEADKLKREFNQWEDVDHAVINGIQDVSQLSFQIDRRLQHSKGIVGQELEGWINLVLSPQIVGSLVDNGFDYPIQLALPSYGSLQTALGNVPILSQFGTTTPLLQFVKPQFIPQMPSNVFNDFLATVVILIKPNNVDALAVVQRNVDAYLKQYQSPPGIQLNSDGKLGRQSEVVGTFTIYAIIIVFLMYGILVIRFRSFSQPFLIYVTIPLSFVGSIVGLFISGQSLTFIGILGITGLTGIVINDGILLVDTANYWIKKGSPVNYAILRAAKSRFFPVILTSVTTIIGLIPLLFSTNMFSQLALTFVAGLFSSTLLLLFVVPVLYQRLMK